MGRRALEPADFPFFDYRRFTFSLGIEASGAVWLSGNTAARFDPAGKRMVVEGDLIAQAGVAFEKMRLTLEAGGLGLRDVVRAVEYVTPAALADYPRMAALERELFGDDLPAASAVVVRSLLRPEALIEIEAVATRSGRPVEGGQGRRAGDVLYLSALTAPAAGGDPVAQARRIYGRAGEILRAAGLRWANVVRTAEILTPPALGRLGELDGVRALHLDARGAATSRVVMPRLVEPGALLQLEIVAAAGQPEAVGRGWGARAGRLLLLSAQGSTDPDTGAVEHPGDIVAQSRQIYANLERALRSAGAGLGAIVKTTEFVAPDGLAEYRKTADVRREVFEPPYPAATGVVCDRLLHPELLLSVEAVAVLD